MKKRFILGVWSLILSMGAAYAEEQIPGAIKAKMDGYVGIWEFSEDSINSPGSDPVSISGEWSAKWVFDHLIEWRATFNSGDATVTTVEHEGYDRQNRGFSYWFTSAGSRGVLYDGVWDGNTASFEGKSFAPDGTPTRSRCKFAYNEDFTRVEYACETIADGEWWTSRKGSAKKK